MAQPDKLLPNEPQAEKLVLGTIMTERNALNEVRDILSPECFYDKLNRAVYEAITAIDARGESPDLVTVANEMRKQSDTVDFYTLSQIGSCYTNDIYQHAAILHAASHPRSDGANDAECLGQPSAHRHAYRLFEDRRT